MTIFDGPQRRARALVADDHRACEGQTRPGERANARRRRVDERRHPARAETDDRTAAAGHARRRTSRGDDPGSPVVAVRVQMRREAAPGMPAHHGDQIDGIPYRQAPVAALATPGADVEDLYLRIAPRRQLSTQRGDLRREPTVGRWIVADEQDAPHAATPSVR
jgi:hypothetical protein